MTRVRGPHGAGGQAQTKRGLYTDGGGLCLQVASGGSRSWIFRYRLGGRRRHLGLGGFRP